MENSAFSPFLKTNYAATTEDIPILTDLLVGPISELAELDEEIRRIQDHLRDLINRRKKLSNDILKHQALLSPSRRLPIDVLQEIFIRCLPETHNAVISRHHCPILLTQVCSLWRQIALSTAALWASIHIPISDSRFSTLVKPELRVIGEWLGRSGACVLNISLHDPPIWGMLGRRPYEYIMDDIIPLCERWGTFSCDSVTSGIELSRIASLPPSSFPRLHTLTITGVFIQDDMSTEDANEIFFWKNSGILAAPNIRNFTYNLVTEDFTRFPLRWGQLTSLSLDLSKQSPAVLGISLAKIGNILNSCKLLRYCHLFTPQAHSMQEDTLSDFPTIVTLPHLTHFSIHTFHKWIASLLKILNMPKLQRLEFHVGTPVAFNDLHDLLRRMGPTLHHLTLDLHGMLDEEVLACLRLCPNLNELEFQKNYDDYGYERVWTPTLDPNYSRPNYNNDDYSPPPRPFGEDFIRRLFATNPSEEILLPQLKAIRFTIFSPYACQNFSDSCILEAVNARNIAATIQTNPAVAKIEKLYVAFGGPQQDSILAELELLQKDNVDCQLDFWPQRSHIREKPRATTGLPVPRELVPVF